MDANWKRSKGVPDPHNHPNDLATSFLAMNKILSGGKQLQSVPVQMMKYLW
mgnify:FL=1